MKVLTLNSLLQRKIDRLKKPLQNARFSGNDINSYGNRPIVAVVGTRKPTPYGRDVTRQIVEELAGAGVIIISGLALGVDVLAHETALKSGGLTVAVLPSGLDKPYPATNARIAQKILERGTLISEYENGHIPRRYDFLHRNRIVAALADAVFIPEATTRSGSLNTARVAAEMGVPVLVLPGNVTSPMSGGTNKLLVDGIGQAVTSTKDILQALNIQPTAKKQTSLDLSRYTDQEGEIIAAITEGVTDNDSLLIRTNQSVVELQTNLSMLEIQGSIKQTSLGAWHIA